MFTQIQDLLISYGMHMTPIRKFSCISYRSIYLSHGISTESSLDLSSRELELELTDQLPSQMAGLYSHGVAWVCKGYSYLLTVIEFKGACNWLLCTIVTRNVIDWRDRNWELCETTPPESDSMTTHNYAQSAIENGVLHIVRDWMRLAKYWNI